MTKARTSYLIVEHNKDIIYKYAKENKDITNVQFMEKLNLTKGQVAHATRYLVSHRHLTKTIRRGSQGRFAYYNATGLVYNKKDKPPVRRTIDPAITALSPEAKAVAKIYRLLDREPTAQPKKVKRTLQVSIQSGMQMFGGW